MLNFKENSLLTRALGVGSTRDTAQLSSYLINEIHIGFMVESNLWRFSSLGKPQPSIRDESNGDDAIRDESSVATKQFCDAVASKGSSRRYGTTFE